MPASENVNRFITSFMQSLDGCGPIVSSSHSPTRRVLTAAHQDSCVIDIPEEVIAAMTPDQLRIAFGEAVLNRATTSFLNLGGAYLPAAPTEREAPTAEMDMAEFDNRCVNGVMSTTSLRRGIQNSDHAGPLSTVSANRVDATSTHASRGRKFMALARTFGLKLNGVLEIPIGLVLHEMYRDMENRVVRSGERERRYSDEFNRLSEDWKAKVEMHKAHARTVAQDVQRLEDLRTAAVAWRDNSGTATEKFETFQKMMSAIDVLSPAAPGELEVELPPASIVLPEEATADLF